VYQHYFGLSETPFSIAVNPRYLFMGARHREALAHLLYGVGSGGFILLTGEVGTGKTTLTRCLLEQLPEHTDVAMVLNPALDAPELLAAVCDQLEIAHRGHASTLKELTDSLHRFLLENHARGRRTVLLIDEAQHLGLPVLEQIRLLTNLETHEEKLLQIILVGQPELAELLRRPELRQLNQRITARFNLTPLDAGETRAYIRHRLEVAGLPADRELFPPAVAARVHRLSGGIPRLINLLCDRALLGAYGRGEARASRRLLDQAAREVLGTEGGGAAPPRRLVPWLALTAAVVLVAASLGGWLARDGGAAGGLLEGGPDARGDASVARDEGGRPAPTPALAAAPSGPAVRAPDAEASAGEAPAWMLPPGEALRRAWRALVPITEVAALPADLDSLCRSGGLTQPVSCLSDRSDSWRGLPEGTWPALLTLRTTRGYLATGVWLGAEGDLARLWTPDGVARVPLTQLAEHWNGAYALLWRPPAHVEQPLGPGSEGEAVAEVARRFATLDGQSRPLADRTYTPALAQRVRWFQESEGLEADGWAGERTLLRLQTRLQPPTGPEDWHRRLGGS
jgi:general secretion pathway protein A